MKNLKSFENYTILGRTEEVTITNNDGQSITKTAKIDTGSYSSRISSDIAKELKLPVIDEREIKSPNGEDEDRTFVELQFNINGVEIKTQAGIADMDDLRNEVAIGRRDIEMVDGIVDVKKDASDEIEVTSEPTGELDIPEDIPEDIPVGEPVDTEVPPSPPILERPTPEKPSGTMSFESFNESLINENFTIGEYDFYYMENTDGEREPYKSYYISFEKDGKEFTGVIKEENDNMIVEWDDWGDYETPDNWEEIDEFVDSNYSEIEKNSPSL